MRKTTILAFAALAIAAAGAHAEPPASVAQTICRPEFKVDGEALAAGTAFLLRTDDSAARTLLVSAHHLFGPSGGLPAQIAWPEMSTRVGSMRCIGIAQRQVWQGGRALTLEGAMPVGRGYLRDLAAFPLVASPGAATAAPLRLARTAPKVGDPVWLLAQVAKGAPPNVLLHRAVVTYAREDALEYRFDNSELGIRATSGAPVLNAGGEVVSVNLAGGLRDGKFTATGNSLASMRALLSAAK